MEKEPSPVPRRATPADARVVAQMLFDFNTEFETETPAVDRLAARLESLLAREDVVAVIAPDAPGADELLLALAVPNGGRPHARVGGLLAADAVGEDGLH